MAARDNDTSELLRELKIDREDRRPRARGRLALLGLLVLLALGGGLWVLRGRPGQAPTVRTAVARATADAGGPPTALDASGYVTARRQATVSAKITGKVVEVLIDRLFANSPDETRTQPEKEFAVGFAKQIGDIGALVTRILVAVFFTILILTGNAMAQSIRERIPELAILKTLGFSDVKAGAPGRCPRGRARLGLLRRRHPLHPQLQHVLPGGLRLPGDARAPRPGPRLGAGHRSGRRAAPGHPGGAAAGDARPAGARGLR